MSEISANLVMISSVGERFRIIISADRRYEFNINSAQVADIIRDGGLALASKYRLMKDMASRNLPAQTGAYDDGPDSTQTTHGTRSPAAS